MTDEVSGAELDAELARRADAEGQMSTSLADLELHPGLLLMSTVSPTSRTGERWAQARGTLAGLWRDFETYRRVVATAQAVRARRPRPGEPELAELRHLLLDPSVEVSRTAFTLAERGLFGPVHDVETITLGELAARMDVAFIGVSEFAETCHAIRQGYLIGLASLAERVRALRGLVGDLTVGGTEPRDPDVAMVAALAARIAELERASTDDPLSLAGEPPVKALVALDVDITAAAGQLARLETLRAGWEDLLAELNTAIMEIGRLRDDVEQTRQRALELIDSQVPAMPPDRLPALLAGLAALREPAGWLVRVEALAGLGSAADDAAAELHAVGALAAGMVDRRDELRGRFASYRAKATRLGHAERPELLALDQRIERLLWTKPCDLAAATRALAGFQRLVNESGAADTPGRFR